MTPRLAYTASQSQQPSAHQTKNVDRTRRHQAPRAANENFATHRQVTEGNLGTVTGELAFVERLAAGAELEQQSRIIAAKLQEVGWDPYRRDEAGDVVMVGLLSGAVIHGDRYRNCNLIPTVAKRNRAGVLAAFTYWHENTPGAKDYCRYAVVSSGPRVRLADLPERYRMFNARLGRFVERVEERFGVVVQITTLEQTFRREDDGGISSNLHANLVYWPKRALGAERWTEFLHWTRKTFGVDQFEDAGRLENPEEVIKYALKPSEILELTPEETRQVAEFLHRKQLVRSYAEFGAFLKDLKDSKHKVRYDAAARRLVRMRMRTHEEELAGDVARSERERDAAAKPKRERRDPPENQILFQTLPQSRASLLREPFVGIRNYDPDSRTEDGKKGLRILQERREQALRVLREKGWKADAIEASCSRLDTCAKIPPGVIPHIATMPVLRRERLMRRLGLDPEDSLETVLMALPSRLDRWLPKERHEFPPVAETFAQLAARPGPDEDPDIPEQHARYEWTRRHPVEAPGLNRPAFDGASTAVRAADRDAARRESYERWRDSLGHVA